MQRFFKVFVVVGMVCAFGAARAQNVTGMWKGTMSIDVSKLPKAKDASQKSRIDMISSFLKAVKVDLSFTAKKTFTLKITGMPQAPGSNGKAPTAQTAEGTWVQKGAVITLKISKANGEAPKGNNPPQEIKILEGGKKLVLVPPAAASMGAKITFIR